MAGLITVDIANMALGILTESPIDSLDEDSRAARMCNLHFDTVREAELTKREWVFARKTALVEPVALDYTTDGWSWSYELPSDALRLLPDDCGFAGPWRQEGSTVTTIEGGARLVRYIANLIDPNDWPAVFTDVLVAALAVKIAHPITAKTTMVELAKQSYREAVGQAQAVNAVQKGYAPGSSSWMDDRAGYQISRHGARARHGYGS